MNDITQHIEQLTEQLNELDLKCKCKFSAWCLNALMKESNVKSSLFELTQTNANYQMLEAIVQACWYDYNLINSKPSLELIDELQFDEDKHSNLSTEIGIINELLMGIECVIKGIQSNESAYFANVAENILNWRDIELQFYSSDEASLLEKYQNEYKNQIYFLNDLKKEKLDNLSLSDYR